MPFTQEFIPDEYYYYDRDRDRYYVNRDQNVGANNQASVAGGAQGGYDSTPYNYVDERSLKGREMNFQSSY